MREHPWPPAVTTRHCNAGAAIHTAVYQYRGTLAILGRHSRLPSGAHRHGLIICARAHLPAIRSREDDEQAAEQADLYRSNRAHPRQLDDDGHATA